MYDCHPTMIVQSPLVPLSSSTSPPMATPILAIWHRCKLAAHGFLSRHSNSSLALNWASPPVSVLSVDYRIHLSCHCGYELPRIRAARNLRHRFKCPRATQRPIPHRNIAPLWHRAETHGPPRQHGGRPETVHPATEKPYIVDVNWWEA